MLFTGFLHNKIPKIGGQLFRTFPFSKASLEEGIHHHIEMPLHGKKAFHCLLIVSILAYKIRLIDIVLYLSLSLSLSLFIPFLVFPKKKTFLSISLFEKECLGIGGGVIRTARR